ncbi:MAG: right-handed parallel beta-helix repeat-containing protein, partial [Anaerolineae bacterium]|nr:right-handed parallel beta-helix repeat-containing protein [Anaerolineae bacterium]
METCATTALHTYNLYWRNGHDFAIDGSFVDQPGPGEIFADPRFTDADNKDFRPLADSPVVDAGDPSDPAPPGSGGRIDLGYAQAAEASVYASKDYCEQCLNDGLAWQVTAFDTIQDAVDNVPGIAGLWTVGVAGGSEAQPAVYHEHVLLPSGVRLVGESADTTVIDADDSGSPLTLDNVANVEVRGFTITNGGEDPGDAGIAVTGSSNQITITRNILGGISPDDPSLAGNGNAGVLFAGGATGSILFNTIVANYGSGVVVADPASWLDVRYNIVAFNDAGLDNS